MLSSSSIYVTNRLGKAGLGRHWSVCWCGAVEHSRSDHAGWRGHVWALGGDGAAAPAEVSFYLRRGMRRWPRRKTSVALVAGMREAFYTDTTLPVAINREERRAPMEKLARKPCRKRKARELVI